MKIIHTHILHMAIELHDHVHVKASSMLVSHVILNKLPCNHGWTVTTLDVTKIGVLYLSLSCSELKDKQEKVKWNFLQWFNYNDDKFVQRYFIVQNVLIPHNVCKWHEHESYPMAMTITSHVMYGMEYVDVRTLNYHINKLDTYPSKMEKIYSHRSLTPSFSEI